jgi:hypothetical protein
LREDNGTDDKVNKRSRRTASPSSVRRDIAEKRKERERKKKEKRDSKLEQRRQEKLNKFMEEVLADVPEDETTPIGALIGDIPAAIY